jgi:uncharacterized protein YaiL (DUF2058 family)
MLSFNLRNKIVNFIYREARHHLAAAQLILDRHKETLEQQEGTEDEKEARFVFKLLIDMNKHFLIV